MQTLRISAAFLLGVLWRYVPVDCWEVQNDAFWNFGFLFGLAYALEFCGKLLFRSRVLVLCLA